MTYQASGIFAPLTVPELAQLDKIMWEAQTLRRHVWPCSEARLRDELEDIRRDVNAEWGNR